MKIIIKASYKNELNGNKHNEENTNKNESRSSLRNSETEKNL